MHRNRSRHPFASLCVLVASTAWLAAHAEAQTVLPNPTATDMIMDFGVTDGTWERSPTGFPIEDPPLLPEDQNQEGPQAELIDVATKIVGGSMGPFPVPGLEGLTANLKGLSQNANGVLEGHDPGLRRDFVLTTWSRNFTVGNISRFGQDHTDDDLDGRAGALQWGFDLSPLDDYLANSALSLDALEVNLNVDYDNGGTRQYDVLLSYTDANEGISLADISTTIDEGFSGAEDNYHILLKPARNGQVGDLLGDDPRTSFSGVGDYNGDDIVDAADYTAWRDTVGDSVPPGEGADGDESGTIDAGDYGPWNDNYGSSSADAIIEPNTHKVIANNIGGGVFDGSQTLTTIDLLPLYEQGVRELNLVAVTAGFGPNRNFSVKGPNFSDPNNLADPIGTFGSGVFISTSPVAGAQSVPEPTTLSMLLLAAAGLRFRRVRSIQSRT